MDALGSRTVRDAALTLGAVLIATIARWALDPWLGSSFPLSTVYGAVAFAVWLGGLRMALLATVLGFITCQVFVVERPWDLGIEGDFNFVGATIFAGTCGLITAFGEAMHRQQRRKAEIADAAVRSEAKLRESEDRLRQATSDLEFQKYAIDQSSIVAITDVHGTIQYVNDKFCEISGYSRNELIGQNHRIINSGFHPKSFFRDMYLTISRGDVWRGEIRNRRKDGSFYWVDTTIVPAMGDDGKPLKYVAIRNDITERKQVESDLEFQKYALDQSSIVAITDVEGTITYVNDKFCQISGYSRQELIGQNHRIINSGLHPREFFRNMYLTISQGRVWHGEIRNQRKDGSYYWVDTTIVPSIGPDGKPDRYVAIRNDVTERKEAEERLARHAESLSEAVRTATQQLEEVHERQRSAERLVAMGTLAAGLGHDLGNLLLPMDARIDGLKMEPLSAKGADDLRSIEAAVQYLRNAVQGLRSLAMDAKTNVTGETVTDLVRWWPQTMPILKAALPRGVRLENDILSAGVDNLVVAGSPHQLTQIVFNLVQNAGEALMHSDSRQRVVRISAIHVDGRVRITVHDNGKGMSEEVRRRCLEPFFTTKKKSLGGGMGLSLVASIIDRLQGEITVDSELDQGTSFHVSLPAASRTAMGTAVESASAIRTAALSVSDQRIRGLIEWTLRAHRVAVFDVGQPRERISTNLWIVDPVHEHAAHDFVQNGGRCAVVVSDPPKDSKSGDGRVLYCGRSPSAVTVREVIQKALEKIPEQDVMST